MVTYMSVHNLKRGDRAFSLNLRRVVKIVRVLEKHCRYEVETVGNQMSSESECYELVPIDKRNQRVIDKVERLVGSLR
jgi:hypothetical protein